MTDIKFGTDGWRAVLGKDFTIENTKKVVNGISNYIYKQSGYNNKIIIGYDPRNKADEFAQYIAETLFKSGFNVLLSDKIAATPVIAYSALKLNAYAVMVTASHNPPEYLGIKFIPPYGGPAEDFMTEEIVNSLGKEFHNNEQKGSLELVSFDEDYINHIKKIIDIKKIKEAEIKINYDGHHGAGASLFKRILNENQINAIYQNMERDINFGGNLPDPKEKYLTSLKELCKNNGRIGLSNDGDGDRFGVFDENGTFICANDIICMLLKHLIKNKNLTGKLAKTVGASSMLDLYAGENNVEVIETPVGFKWLGEAMRKNDVIIAGEESGGLSIKGHIPEKDGILANLLIMEMMAYENKPLFELHNIFLNELNRKFYNDRIDIKLDNKEKQDEIISLFKTCSEIGGYQIVKKNELDGLKLYLTDKSTVLIRKSGTEPLLRIYLETDKEEKLQVIGSSVKQLI